MTTHKTLDGLPYSDPIKRDDSCYPPGKFGGVPKGIRLCWWCKHFSYHNAVADWSEDTPGNSFELYCGKQKWEYDPYETSLEQFREIICTAEKCECFEKRDI